MSIAESLQRLPPRAQVAIAARCALRVLPAFTPQEVATADLEASELQAALICCLIAVRKSTSTSDTYRELAKPAQRRLILPRKGAARTNAGHALKATAYVATALDAKRLWAPGGMAAVLVGHDAIGEHLGIESTFAESLADDLSVFEPGFERWSGAVPWTFFARALFRQTPPAWTERYALLRESLERLDLARLRHLYAALVDGANPDQADVLRALEEWKRSLPHAKAPRRRKAAPASAFHEIQPVDEEQPGAATPDVWMLADRPLEAQFSDQDRFRFVDYADALAAILDHPKTGTPFTMAINAPWGAGKSTLANMVAAQLEQRPKDRGDAPHIICRFNAWMHDDAPNLATAFVSEISRTANRHRAWFVRLLWPLPWALLEPGVRRRRRIWVGGLTLLLAVGLSSWFGVHLHHVEEGRRAEAARTVAHQSTETIVRDAAGNETSRNLTETGVRSRSLRPEPPPPARDPFDPVLGGLQTRLVILGAFLTALAGLISIIVKLLTSTSLGGFVQSPEKAAESGAIQSAQLKLKQLVTQATWRGNRLVVFVDDVERCKPPRSIDVLDAVSQLVDHHGVIVVLLGDMSAVAAAAQLKYKDLAEIYVPSAGIALGGGDHGKEAFGRLYLQKIVQFQFDLPIPPSSRIKDYMGQLAITPAAKGGQRSRVAV